MVAVRPGGGGETQNGTELSEFRWGWAGDLWGETGDFVPAHPSDKNKDVPRLPHLLVAWFCEHEALVGGYFAD
jgi:hypothetical protein